MSVTVQWLIKSELFETAQCIAGNDGVQNIISGINIMDNPDTVPWLKKNELVLSTGYLFRSTDIYTHIITDLHEQGCSGLGIKMNRYIDELPKEMLEQANTLHFPIFSVPFSCTMEQIVNLVYRKIFADEMNETQRISALYREVTEDILKHRSLHHVMQTLSGALEAPTFLTSAQFEVIDYAIPKDCAEVFPFVFSADADTLFSAEDVHTLYTAYQTNPLPIQKHEVLFNQTHRCFQLFAITQKRMLLGWLVCLESNRPLVSSDFSFLSGIQSLLSIALLNSSLFRTDNRSGLDIFYFNILTNAVKSSAESELLCQQYGFDYLSDRICVVFHVAHSMESSVKRRKLERRITHTLDDIAAGYKQKAMYTVFNNAVVLFLFFPDGSPSEQQGRARELTSAIVQQLSASGVSAKAGIGLSASGSSTIFPCYTQAVQAIELGEHLHPDETIFSYQTDYIYHLLRENFPTERIAAVYDTFLKPLEDYDRDNHTELCHTLRTFLSERQNVTRTAQQLFIHRNTMMYRMEQIQEITGIDYKNLNAVFLYQLSFYFRDIL